MSASTASTAGVTATDGDRHGGGKAHHPPAGEGLTHRQILTILTGLMLGMFLAALDQTIVATAIRTIGDDLKGLSIQAWVTTAYLITSTITTPLYGKLSDIFGRRPLFLIAIAVFVIGSAACAFSTSMYMLAGFRAFQGLGAGGLFSLALAIIGDIVSPRERAKYQGYFLAVFGTSSVLGPVIGGFFAGQSKIMWVSGWRWVFLVNVPIGIAALIVVTRTLHVPHTRLNHRIDYLGALMLVVGLVPLLTVLEQGQSWGWGSGRSWACYAVSAVGLLAFVGAEYRVGDEALIPLRFFRYRMFSIIAIVGLVTGAGMFGGLSVLPLYLQIVRGATPTESGLLLLPLTGGIMVGSVISGQLISRTGRYKIFPIIGTALMIVGIFLLHTVGADTAFWRTEIYTAVFGLGLGNVMQPITLAVQNAMAPRDIGVATSSVTFFRQMGATIGTAVFLSILFSTVGNNIGSAFRKAASTAGFARAVNDPTVRANPNNGPILKLLTSHTTGVSSSSLDDTSFLKHADKILAEPFFVGFSKSMDQVFLVGAFVLVVGFVFLFAVKEIPLRTTSGIQARAGGADAPTTAGPGAGATAAPATDAAAAELATTAQLPVTNPGATPVASPGADPGATAAASAGPSVRGRIEDAAGEAVAGAVLTLTDLHGRQADLTRSGADGRYRLGAATAETYLLICVAEGLAPTAALVVVGPDGLDRDITLAGTGATGSTPRSGSVTGTVLRSATSGNGRGTAPVDGAMVAATDRRGAIVATTSTAADGRYRFRDLAADEYTIAASGAGYRPVVRSAVLAAGETLRLDLELTPGGEVTGVVRVAGSLVGHDRATVTLVDASGAVVASTLTRTDGSFRIGDLVPGPYTVVTSGYAPVAARVEVPADHAAAVTVVLGDGPGAVPADGLGDGPGIPAPSPADRPAADPVYGAPTTALPTNGVPGNGSPAVQW